MHTRIESFLAESATSCPDRVALMCDGRQWTYKNVEDASNAFADTFISHGLLRNERVAVFLDNSAEAVVSIFAILKAGGIFVVLGGNTKPARLTSVLNDCTATALVTDSKGATVVEKCCKDLPHLKHIYVTAGLQLPPHHVGLNSTLPGDGEEQPSSGSTWSNAEPAALIYTSGSTGESKGVLLSHQNIYFSTVTIAHYLSNSSHDLILNVLPLSHTYGLTQLMTAFHAGATLILDRTSCKPREILDILVRERVSGFALVPAIARALSDLDLGSYDLPALRYITNAAAALPVPVIRKFRQALPHVQLFAMYGLTECMRASFLPPEQIDMRPTSIGRGLPHQQMYIEDQQGARVGPGITGELVVQGPNVMWGYWNRPQETAQVLKQGAHSGEKLLYTGDLFSMDEEGFFYFVGRKDDIIKSCGEKVSLLNVEEVLNRLEGIEEAAVVPVPDPILGNAIKAVVKLKDNVELSRREILRHCARHLEIFEVPTLIEFCAALPKTPSGKIQKYKLVENSTRKHEPGRGEDSLHSTSEQ